MMDDYVFLTEKHFKEISDKEKWEYVTSIIKIIKELRVMANKNCEECEKRQISPHDLNIDYLFEDWRGCAENCEECGKEEKANMCQLQFELMSLIANSLADISERQNAVAKLVIKKDEHGNKLLKKISEANEKDEKNSANIYG